MAQSNPVDLQELKSKAVTGSIWAIIEKFSLQIVQFVVGVILARLLEPKDYGLIALTGIFTSISAAITDGGFEKTLIQKRDLSPIQINTVFYVNIFLGALMALLLILFAPSIAGFFNAPKLVPVLRVVSVGLFITSFGQTQRTLLMKELHFKKISYAQITSSAIGGIAGVTLAYNGAGVWALVFSGLTSQLVMLSFFWIRSSWYPKFQFSYGSIKQMLPYGYNILFSSLVFFSIQQFNTFIVGKCYSKADLGLFNRGSRFPELVTGIIESVILKMSFPLFAKLQDDKDQLIRVLQKTVRLAAFISFPLLATLLIDARDITLVLFTQKWLGSVIFLEAFCLVKLLHPFVAIYREVILARGKAYLLTRILVVTTSVEVLLVLFLIKYGIFYVIVASFASIVMQYIIYIFFVGTTLPLRWYTHLNWLKPYFLNALFLILITVVLERILSGFAGYMVLKLSIKIFVGLLSYISMAYVFKFDEFAYFKLVFQNFRKKFNLKQSSLSVYRQ